MSVESMYQDMKSKLEKVVPDFELRYKAELAEEINQLKKEKNAVILDTRKTAPGSRLLDTYAVRMGGGQNHRTGLFDM